MRRMSLVITLWLSIILAVGNTCRSEDKVARDQQKKEERPKETTRTEYRDVATIVNDGKSMAAIGARLPSGFTLVHMDTSDPNKSGVVMSAARISNRRLGADFRVIAIDRNGVSHEALSQSVVAASGTKHEVVTLMCEFAVPQRQIHKWTIQRKILIGYVDLGIVKSAVFDCDEEEEKMPLPPAP